MGLGKSFRKAWKKTLGWADDDWAKQAAITAVAAAATGGLAGAALGALGAAEGVSLGTAALAGAKTGAVWGGAGGALMGGMQGYQNHQQEKSIKAQIASAEKIAAMQNNTVVSAAPIPTQTLQKAAISEQNDATRKARAFRLANSVRSGTLGGGNSGKRKTLG